MADEHLNINSSDGAATDNRVYEAVTMGASQRVDPPAVHINVLFIL